MNRSNRQPQPSHSSAAPAPASDTNSGSTNNKGSKTLKSLRIVSVALLFSITVLIVALVWYLVIGGPANESKYVQKDRLQAVFLNGGQVYFGNIRDINDSHVRLTNIFYLRVDQQVQPEQESSENAGQNQQQNGISLVKLGCELHRPTNEMLINRDQVVFWENLKEDSAVNTVPGAVKEYIKQYPNGQECQAPAQQNNQNNSNTNTQENTNTENQTNTEQ